jgi:hypothetical protein
MKPRIVCVMLHDAGGKFCGTRIGIVNEIQRGARANSIATIYDIHPIWQGGTGQIERVVNKRSAVGKVIHRNLSDVDPLPALGTV